MKRLLALLLVVAACGDGADPTVPPATEPPPVTTTTAVPPPPTTVAEPAPTTSTAPPATTTSSGSTTTIGSAVDVSLGLEVVAEGLEAPVFFTSPPGDPRLFVVDQPGRVLVVAREGGAPQVFLDIEELVSFGGERGLLGLAFHPEYAANGRLFVHYSDNAGDTALVEYRVDAADPGRADPATARRLLDVAQPAGNHNGGMLAFGPDGMLYLGLGDGGGANDRFGHGQRPDTLLAAILRLDVDAGDPYAIPSDNPFVAGGGAPEVWAYGLRNPWRFAFDPADGLVYVADVGQNEWEEVDVVGAGTPGLNFGWPIMEGNACFSQPDCSPDGLELPAFAYDHSEGCSITGGYVYRGAALPELDGHYFYGDFCTGFVRSWHRDTARTFDWTAQLGQVRGLASFGVDAAGELYLTSTVGTVWRLVRG